MSQKRAKTFLYGCLANLAVAKCTRAMERDEPEAGIGRAEVAPHEAGMRRDGPAPRVQKCAFS